MAGAARHKAARACSAAVGPNRSRKSLRSWPARKAPSVSSATVGTPSLSATCCSARVESAAESRLSGLPYKTACQNEPGKGGIGGGAGSASGAVCDDPGATGGHCVSSLGALSTSSEQSDLSTHDAELGWFRGGPNSSGTFSSSHRASSRQEPFMLARAGPTIDECRQRLSHNLSSGTGMTKRA